MPLVLIVGRPSSGKTTVACQIHAAIKQLSPDQKTDILDDQSTRSATQNKSDSYRDSKQEKMTLGALRSSVERRLSRQSILLFDSLNLVKGYRYELWALARQVGTRCCVVSIETGVERCKAWNAGRAPGERYEDEVMEDLVGRLERPDSIRRWESPLFTIHPDRQSKEEIAWICEEVAKYCIGSDYQQERKECRQSGCPDPTATVAATGHKAGDLQTSIATARSILAPTNLLHDIDKEVQSAIKHIVDAQALAGGAPAGVISFGPGMPILNATRPVTTVELRRWKRMFVKMVTNNTFSESHPKQVSALFIQYVSQQIHGCG